LAKKKVAIKVDRNKLLPCGVDIGIDGGFGMVAGDRVLLASRVVADKIALQVLEGDHKKLTAKDKKKPRYVDGTLVPGNSRIFDSMTIIGLLGQAKQLARQAGFGGIYVAVEQPQLHIGKSDPASYLVTGGCFHTWGFALSATGTSWGVVSPTHWKSGLKLTSNKLLSVTRLSEWLPHSLEIRLENGKRLVDDHNVSEAVLLAYWLQKHCTYYLDTENVAKRE